MRVTIVPSDKKVVVDGVAKNLGNAPWAQMSPAVHAVQFDGNSGEIEWVSVMGGMRPANQRINLDEFTAMFGAFVDAWNAEPMGEGQ